MNKQDVNMVMTTAEVDAAKRLIVELTGAVEWIKQGIDRKDRQSTETGYTLLAVVVDAMARKQNIILTRPAGAPKAVINAQGTQA